MKGYTRDDWECQDRVFMGTLFSVQLNPDHRSLIMANLMHVNMPSSTSSAPDVTCPSDFADNVMRDEIVYIDDDVTRPGKLSQKKPSAKIEAKSVPDTPKSVASSTGETREQWLEPI